MIPLINLLMGLFWDVTFFTQCNVLGKIFVVVTIINCVHVDKPLSVSLRPRYLSITSSLHPVVLPFSTRILTSGLTVQEVTERDEVPWYDGRSHFTVSPVSKKGVPGEGHVFPTGGVERRGLSDNLPPQGRTLETRDAQTIRT